jgi:hypothetical protein
MKMFTCKFAQDEVTHQRLRVGSKKHALSLPEGSVQTCPEAARREGRAWFSVSRRGPPLFDARSVCVIREHGKMATCLREAAPAKAGNAAGGFFQQTHCLPTPVE